MRVTCSVANVDTSLIYDVFTAGFVEDTSLVPRKENDERISTII